MALWLTLYYLKLDRAGRDNFAEPLSRGCKHYASSSGLAPGPPRGTPPPYPSPHPPLPSRDVRVLHVTFRRGRDCLARATHLPATANKNSELAGPNDQSRPPE